MVGKDMTKKKSLTNGTFIVDMPFTECQDRLLHFGLKLAHEAAYIQQSGVSENSIQYRPSVEFTLSSTYTLIDAKIVLTILYMLGKTEVDIQVNHKALLGISTLLFFLGSLFIFLPPSTTINPIELIICLVVSTILYFLLKRHTIYQIKRLLMQLLSEDNLKNDRFRPLETYITVEHSAEYTIAKLKQQSHLPTDNHQIDLYIRQADAKIFPLTIVFRRKVNNCLEFNHIISGHIRDDKEQALSFVQGRNQIFSYMPTLLIIACSVFVMTLAITLEPVASGVIAGLLILFGLTDDFIKRLQAWNLTVEWRRQLRVVFPEHF